MKYFFKKIHTVFAIATLALNFFIASAALAQSKCYVSGDCSTNQTCIDGVCQDNISPFDACVLANSQNFCCADPQFKNQTECKSITTPSPSPISPTPGPTPISPTTPSPGPTPISPVSNGCPDDVNYQKVNGVCVPNTPFTGGLAGPDTKSITDLITIVVKYLLMFAGIVGVIILIIGGYLYMTSSGNEEQVEKGRKAIVNAIIGLVVVILSYTIISVVTNFITTK